MFRDNCKAMETLSNDWIIQSFGWFITSYLYLEKLTYFLPPPSQKKILLIDDIHHI